ncbi:CsxC family protein [Bacillus sp. SCS-153A]|uniref:CsxC family protein n=1 Tax=Rossellomorea sedimentorum TaxID=3115294 RepID=UPI003905A2CC
MSDSYKEKNENHCKPKHHHPHVKIGKVITKVPVLLAELSLTANMSATIKFPEPVLEIKDVKKRVKITQCRLLLPSNKLFISGFVRKNIQYASPSTDIEQTTSSSIASDLHSYTVDVPFTVITEIKKYISDPVLPRTNSREEFDFFVAQPLPSGFPEKDELLSSDLSQFHQTSAQFYNELPFCELVSSKIIEWDEAIDRGPIPTGSAPLAEGVFTVVEEKMVLDFTIRVLQEQQVRVASHTNDDCHDHHHDHDDDCEDKDYY